MIIMIIIIINFKIQMDHQIPTRKPDLELINKKRKKEREKEFAV